MQHLLSGPVESLMLYLELQALNIENSIKIALVCEEVEEEKQQEQLQQQQRQHRQRQGQRVRRHRTCWAWQWILCRETFGHWENLVQELMREDKSSFRNYHRLDEELFEEVLTASPLALRSSLPSGGSRCHPDFVCLRPCASLQQGRASRAWPTITG